MNKTMRLTPVVIALFFLAVISDIVWFIATWDTAAERLITRTLQTQPERLT